MWLSTHLTSKGEALSSNVSTTKEKKEEATPSLEVVALIYLGEQIPYDIMAS
jgi:primosomal protein N''